MTSKDLYGIDPDALYPWSPRAAYLDKNKAIRDAASAKLDDPAIVELPDDQRKAIIKDFQIEPDLELMNGAPVILLSPLSERLALRIQAARQKMQRIFAKAARAAADRCAKATDEEAESIRDEEAEKAADAAAECFGHELEADILHHCLAGWRNLKRPDGEEIKVPDEKEKRLLCLPASWRAEIVQAIISESAWSAEAVEGFGSRQG